ncbi:bacillithiol biosynthesis cysteine-adding enzyme BshC [Pedobacter sp. MC2016-05]|uniref:bacillithiol biosynthesis cysteine-adding enzyme BshC n=1 Tax=Pedobacter sp. MC2016-05 TaxID=2994474 RepID=UPI0022456F26|nr:bacillithiol biosynthesis cysteine-adding enzyme BshC [Pedobacter sp. MC2016-05]MCX2475882.1 bacillithiol biosynthesis cysteine-adding enzyme BshC [Pedobacter sp. MC2016-05]
MQAKYISYQETGSFSKLVLDYINDEAQLRPFYSYRPDRDGLAQAIENRNFLGDRNILVDVLKNQYRHIQTNKSVTKNIELLASENTFTVTTGHQLNLFTGPLYFIYKIVTAINLAIELKMAHPDKNFVPVYWMATEDHDFEEINHVSVDEKNISWIQTTNGATGRLSTKTVAAAVTAYKGYLGISKNGKHIAKLVEKAYLEHDNLADATRYLVNNLFEKYGLVIVNADEPALKKIFASIIADDVRQHNSSKNIDSTSNQLEEKGYKTQVNGRDINFFYLKDDLRERLIFEDGKYVVNHTDISFTEDELLAEIASNPERFSPNVVMRPMYQELILPNIAYIGGGAEIAYWMQLKANFDFYKVDFPVLLLRNSALLIDKRSAENLYSLGFSLEDIFLPVEELKNLWVKKNSTAQLSLADETRAINSIFDQIKLNAYKIDKTLSVSTDTAKQKTNRLLANLEKKLFRAEKRKHEMALVQIENVKKRLFPNGTMQERTLNIAPMYVNYGEDFLSSCIENFEPLGGDFTLLLP